MRDNIENEVLFEGIDEDPMVVATSLVALNQANILSISSLNERIIEAESAKKKIHDENVSLKTKVKKRK